MLPNYLRNLKVDRAEEVLSELQERGYLGVEGDGWWKAEVLMAMMSQCTNAEADSVRAHIISTSESLTNDKVYTKVTTAGTGKTIFLLVQNDTCCASSSANGSAATSATIPGGGGSDSSTAGSSPPIPDREAGAGEGGITQVTVTTTAADCRPLWLVRARKELDRLIVKCSKVLSGVSTVLITVGNILLLPGVSACIGGVIFGPYAVQAAGSVAVAVGNWLKDAVDSAVARAAVQAQPSVDANVEDDQTESLSRTAKHRGREWHRRTCKLSESLRMLRRALSSAADSSITIVVGTDTQAPTNLDGPLGKVADAPFGQHNALEYLIAKHPKVVSNVSTVLITVGSIVLLPGMTACAAGTIFAHPAVTVAGAIAVVVGKWLRAAVQSATADGVA